MLRTEGKWYVGCRTEDEVLFETEYDNPITAKHELANDFSLFMDDHASWDTATCEMISMGIRAFNCFGTEKFHTWTIDDFTYYIVYYQPASEIVGVKTERELAMLQAPGHW